MCLRLTLQSAQVGLDRLALAGRDGEGVHVDWVSFMLGADSIWGRLGEDCSGGFVPPCA